MEKEFVEKACDYLRSKLYEGFDDWNDKVVISDRCNTVDDFIESFKNYMYSKNKE